MTTETPVEFDDDDRETSTEPPFANAVTADPPSNISTTEATAALRRQHAAKLAELADKVQRRKALNESIKVLRDETRHLGKLVGAIDRAERPRGQA